MDRNKIDVFSRMTAGMKEVLRIQQEQSGDAFNTDVDFGALRRAYAEERTFWNEGAPRMVSTTEMSIAGPHGSISIRIHRPDGDHARPCVLFIHGGGFVVGNLDTHDRIMRVLAEFSGAVVVGIDYRLSPEHKFPVAVEECAAITKYLHRYGPRYGIDPAQLLLAGDSGGANLALATALLLRDRGDDNGFLKGLILYYGLFGLKDSSSQRLLGGNWDGLTRKDLAYYNDCYLETPEDADSPYFDCLSADLSHGIPPTCIVAAALDPLLDDSLTLKQMLAGHGVPCEYRVYEGVLHGFLHYTKILPEANDALRQGAAFIHANMDWPV